MPAPFFHGARRDLRAKSMRSGAHAADHRQVQPLLARARRIAIS